MEFELLVKTKNALKLKTFLLSNSLVINNVGTTRYITLSVEKSNVMTTYVATIHISIEIGDTIAFSRSYDKHNLTFTVISYEIYLTNPIMKQFF